MKIVLAAKYPAGGRLPIGGVQSWCATVGRELQRLGHEVTQWGPEWPVPDQRFDLGIVAHAKFTRAVMARCDRVLVVSHGIIETERPRGNRVAFTSEGVRAHWGMEGPVLRQPIDLDFWSPGGGRQHELLRYSYRGGLDWLGAVASGLGMTYRHVGNVTHEKARDALRSAACVLATGRAALEAMACGVPVVLCDHRSAYQGPLLDPDLEGAIERNYSGRGGIVPTPENVSEAVMEAMAEGPRLDWVREHHDAREVTAQLLEAAGC